ncbi:hypothetical protein ACFO0N_12530 [Halobium salinum]|uniref:DUF7313 domain-containing protein n=1 Tax=Halobium salinum TaxID=1364940 RepID=A0ABD5PDH2_9EURY|nr:hypothetical protein [Halobium salinum]
MQPLQFLVPVGVLADFERAIAIAALVLVLVNMATRLLSYRKHRSQVEDGQEDLSWYAPHIVSSLVLLFVSFMFLIVAPHGGMVLSVLVLGMVITDFFEFEARNVEARNALSLERPKAGLVASVFVLLYASYQALFFLIAPFWNAVI